MLVAEGSKLRPLIRSVAPARRVRVLVVEENEVLRSGLRWLLTRVPWVERCAGAGSLDEALAGGPFDLALVDVGLGLAVCERLSATGAPTALLTSRWDDVPMRVARAAGARGAIAKGLPARELLGAVRELARGGTCEPEPRGARRRALRPARARDPAARLRRADQRRDRRHALPRAGHDQAPHARALREARRAQPRRRRALGAPPRRARRPPRAVHGAGRAASACSSPTRSTSAARASCSPSRGATWVAASAGARTLEDALAVAETAAAAARAGG